MPKNQNAKLEALQEENSSYSPDSDTSSSQIRNLDHRTDQQINEGKWSDEEKLKFVSFMLYYEQIFSSSLLRKHHRIFKKISVFLKSRKPRQCRSHYQKLSKRFKDLGDLKKFYSLKYGAHEFLSAYRKISSEFEPLPKIQEEAPTNNFEPPKHVGVQTDFEPLRNNFFPCLPGFNQQLLYNPYMFMGTYPYWGNEGENNEIKERESRNEGNSSQKR